ncbi:MAG TPA: hypothetical protein DDY25_00885, partial [Peptococcaceae bacterium]|nr:hypothetical protein [Peptococcaceae bacterium]
RKKKLLSLLLSVLLLIGLMPVDQVFAAETGEVLWVNGVNIIDVPDKTVVCGAGSAVYDAETKTLTLTDATIDDGHDGVGIAAESYFNNKVLTVKLVGTNKIAPEPGNNLTMGIRTDGELLVEGDTAGSGTINIATKAADENTLIRGIYAYKGCEIKDVAVTLRDTTAFENLSSAIDANAFQEGYFKCSNATVNVSGYDTGINVPDGHINIDHSRVEIEGANRGVNGGEEVNNFRIKDSTVICTVSGENAVAVANGQDITIDNSQLTLSSTSSNAIFSAGKLVIENGSDVDAAGYYPALFGTTSISIKSGSKVKAVSTHDIAIFSKGFIQLDGVEIHAKGGSGCAAIAARVVKTSSVTDGPKIALANLVEKYGGKIAYISFVSAKDSENKIWTSFIHKGADSLQQNADERLVNALNEVRLGSADSFLADYTKVDEALAVIPSDLSIYTDATANAVIAARDAVLRGKIIDEQDLVDSWATA